MTMDLSAQRRQLWRVVERSSTSLTICYKTYLKADGIVNKIVRCGWVEIPVTSGRATSSLLKNPVPLQL
jgi:hypothetical protein